uniref:Uncharacterized protein n=1 Tax=Oryza sativa subsp. japonica TaxID=39947 RepID=Q2R3N3_ORYSJ|nr:hypothetical protein LOC_Os11g31349 [Oryza sativa Japonica Group]
MPHLDKLTYFSNDMRWRWCCLRPRESIAGDRSEST